MKPTTAKLVERFIADYKKVVEEVYGGDIESALAEDISTYYSIDVKVYKTKVKIFTTYYSYEVKRYVDDESDDDEIREYVKKWRADMRRARRYWATDSDTLDKIADGEKEDFDIDD